MDKLERAAAVARLEQLLEGGQSWDRMLRRCVEASCDTALLDKLNDAELYRQLELAVLEEFAVA